jgi:putative tricarboxylic transport membrane protein
MTTQTPAAPAPRQPWMRLLRRKDVLAGLMFIAVAALGLWLSRNYPIGTALRMGTGYVPRLLCWILLALGAIIFVQGLTVADEVERTDNPQWWRPLIFVPLSLIVFALTIERLGVVIATLLLVVIGAIAGQSMRVVEVGLTAIVLIVLTVAAFVWALGLPIAVWPEW